MQQDMNCYGQVYPAFQAGAPFFTSSDLSICNPEGTTGTTTAGWPGEAIINGGWTADAWLFTPTGDCDYTPADVVREALCEALANEVTFIGASDGFSTTGFDATNSATLPGSCGGERFVLRVTFKGPDDTTGYCNTGGPLPCFVTLSSDNKFQFAASPINPDINYQFYPEGNPRPYVDIGLRRRGDGGGTSNRVIISVSGTRQFGSGSFSGSGRVHLNCS